MPDSTQSDLERENAELRLFRTVFDMAAEGIVVTDGDNRILAVNPAFTLITGYEPSEVIGKDPNVLRSGLQEQSFYDAMWEQVRRTGRWDGELLNRRKNGAIFREWLSIATERDSQGGVLRHIGIFRDVSEAEDTAHRLWRHNNLDPLTELPNRGLLLDRLLQALVIAGRENSRAALLFIGLDGFKTINDTLGHTIGDKLLQEAARRFSGCLREGDTLARFGSDEFVAVLAAAHSVEEVEAVVRTVLESLHEPFLIEAHRILTSASIGISLWPGDGDDVESLMRNATGAMQQAKEAGRGTFRFFTAHMDARAQLRSRLAGELSEALEHGEFSLVYQPLINVRDGRVEGAEALLRWHSRYIGAIGPDQFIPLAEEMGLILPIGEWLLAAACAEAAGWEPAGLGPLSVAINVSPRQVQQTDIAATLERVLKASGLAPERVTVEITESLVLNAGDEVLDKLNRIRALGARIAVDDFGTGYASLSYLKHFPVDQLKIDRSFVADALDNTEDSRLIEAIVALGHSLGMTVVGEGVETKEQLAFLAEHGCDLVQGYRFSPPLAADRFREFVRSRAFILPP
ncbi:bifunctional diguanylate cyclase/phosphodiesterase [Magnetospirillum sp. UT-4]|uniref:putative bifunctional diguanylate cyclase/phosphodiesterase n=1 Tax=Magnetospirillum sp. UT-4 TaxID=2681467 RepID=UPI00137C77AE|nr:GGDEF and EAL domain-containing protein [Magnetospirillum sp. UT-4]CAA7620303.1 putative GGDEF: diguanylate cyclase (GGDEF) domain [Magnetospirillum sp. UT-4]